MKNLNPYDEGKDKGLIFWTDHCRRTLDNPIPLTTNNWFLFLKLILLIEPQPKTSEDKESGIKRKIFVFVESSILSSILGQTVYRNSTTLIGSSWGQ